MAACSQGDYQAALSLNPEALGIGEELGYTIVTGTSLGIFAAVAVAAGGTEKAARLFGAAPAIHDAIGFKLNKVDQLFFDRYTTEAREAMGDGALPNGSELPPDLVSLWG